MPLNFTGQAEPEPAPASATRTPVVILGCFGVAAILGGLVFAAALRQHKADAPGSAPVLVGIDRAAAAPKPAPVDPPPAARPAASPPAPAAPQAQAPAQAPVRPDPAVARARMLAALRQVPHGSVTLSVEDDAGAQAYAQKLAELFRQAGWTVDQMSAFGTAAPRRGLAAALGVSPADEAVREAFDSVGFTLAPPPRDAGILRTPEIFVGVPR